MAQISLRLIKWDLEIRSPHIDWSEGTWMNKDMNEHFGCKAIPSSVKCVTKLSPWLPLIIITVKIINNINKSISQVILSQVWIHHITQAPSMTRCLLVDLTLSGFQEQMSYTHGQCHRMWGRFGVVLGIYMLFPNTLLSMVLGKSDCYKRHG